MMRIELATIIDWEEVFIVKGTYSLEGDAYKTCSSVYCDINPGGNSPNANAIIKSLISVTIN